MSRESFAKATLRLRRTAVLSIMRVVTPGMAKAVTMERRDFAEIDRTPRPFTLMLKERFGGKPLAGVEIGLCEGKNAESMMDELNMRRFYSVEIAPQPYVIDRLSKRKEWRLIYGDSSRVAGWVPEQVDFVYIDGDHSTKAVLKDYCAYLPLLREGGVIGGHDLTAYCAGVFKALQRISAERREFPVMVYPDWWFK